MGYHVTIVRTKRGDPVPITRAEVQALLATRNDLEVRPNEQGELEITVRALGGESPLLLWHASGEIWTKNPDESTMQLLLDLAAALGARVRGDEGETYRSVDESYEHPDDAGANAADKVVSEQAWRRNQWIARLAPFTVFFLLALLVGYCSRR